MNIYEACVCACVMSNAYAAASYSDVHPDAI